MSSDNLLFFKEYEVILWNCDQDPPKQFKSKFEITCTNGEEIMYSFEGAILRVDKIYAGFKEPEVLTNLEQIKNLQWIGQYDQNNLKIGPWQVLWKYEQLTNVGGEYSKQGNKQGQWKEIIQNYWRQV
ncbi:unnamed protein product (macronuclear) [Paramecium tetraurelia]|uniref:Uncharacterized protein n=1 Tax=Paramecium tetraurelia TaxID=5888 RepID=A0CSI9_PARTE|nr:uncharacterized protein GSPATT00010028001 [Paramecium tetraurelia]CAK73756.1 unnamed protein product [Paramecium tetraurelia]|eukprot:XP_001441153.1 hypothetical protein (macronuclear) [Paramecium tetraurelia strain d4-2]